jgi:hypothetical protein
MAKWYELSAVQGFRRSVAEYLEEEGLLPSKNKNETAAAFWGRVEKAGLLVKALDLYDEFADQDVEWNHARRETKKDFAERTEREGRQAEVESARNELLELGYSLREIQKKLVHHFQPLDGERQQALQRAQRVEQDWKDREAKREATMAPEKATAARSGGASRGGTAPAAGREGRAHGENARSAPRAADQDRDSVGGSCR